jgi:hypothetical protein
MMREAVGGENLRSDVLFGCEPRSEVFLVFAFESYDLGHHAFDHNGAMVRASDCKSEGISQRLLLIELAVAVQSRADFGEQRDLFIGCFARKVT